jgi:hypothetical protein
MEVRDQIRIEEAERGARGVLPRLPATTQLLPRKGDLAREIFNQQAE